MVKAVSSFYLKGMLNLYYLLILLLVLLILWFIFRKQFQNLVRPIKYRASFSGAPQYIAGSTSGSPLSELGSHCGFKVVPESDKLTCSALFATVASFGAGRLYDFAVRLYGEKGNLLFKKSKTRKVELSPYCIEERAEYNSYSVKSRLFFLQRNLALLEVEWTSTGNSEKAQPAFNLLPTLGRDLENPYPHIHGFNFLKQKNGGLLLSNKYRVPGQKLFAFFLPVTGEANGLKELRGPLQDFGQDNKIKWSVIISFSADGDYKLVRRAERARNYLEKLVNAAEKRWQLFEDRLPVPYDTKSDETKAILSLSAWALENSLYFPRGKMTRLGSVPSKVYFPFFWGWDTPQHVIGMSEWNPKKAGDILLTQLDGNNFAPRRARFRLRAKGITIIAGAQRNLIPSKLNDNLRGVLDFYSQPPLQSWAAVRVYERLIEDSRKEQFLEEVLPSLRENLQWWEENRKLKNGFFSFLNGLESGLDDSPRFYPPSFLPSFIIGTVPRFFCAIDLNCWLYQSYMNLAFLSSQAGLDDDWSKYLLRAKELKDKIENELWSVEHEAWLDRRNGKYIEVITPSVWWPAFVGACSELDKVKKVIERYILNPDKFWGNYGIPSVAFDDRAYNDAKDGYYWRGQIWMINNYATLEVLFRFGYEDEAAELHERIIQTLYKSEGQFETYNAKTGEVGWSSRGPGDPAVMQFGMSSCWATQILFYRYQHFRYIFPETKKMQGYIQWVSEFERVPVLSPPSVEISPKDAIMQVRVPDVHSYDLPKVFLESGDGMPLLVSRELKLYFEDNANFTGDEGHILFSWKGEEYRVDPGVDYILKPFEDNNKLMHA